MAMIKDYLAAGCEWSFIPPHAPHFGGQQPQPRNRSTNFNVSGYRHKTQVTQSDDTTGNNKDAQYLVREIYYTSTQTFRQ